MPRPYVGSTVTGLGGGFNSPATSQTPLIISHSRKAMPDTRCIMVAASTQMNSMATPIITSATALILSSPPTRHCTGPQGNQPQAGQRKADLAGYPARQVHRPNPVDNPKIRWG